MNHNRHPLPIKLRKKVTKNIKEGQKHLLKEDSAKSRGTAPEKMLKKYPPKIQKLERSILEATAKNMLIKKKKLHSNHSKRTTPGEVSGREAAPASTHPESSRWDKNVKLQAKLRGKILTHKLQKKK